MENSCLRIYPEPCGELAEPIVEGPTAEIMSTTVYILQCANGQYYVGSTTDLVKRIGEHQLADGSTGSPQGYKGAKFTKEHQPVELVYTEEYEDEHKARLRERQLHGWSRAKKEALIRGDIYKLKELSKSNT